MTKRDLVVASTRHHLARLLKYYPRRPCAPSLIKSRFFRILQIYLQYLLSYILKFLICIHAGNPRVPPRVLASGGGGGQKASFFKLRRPTNDVPGIAENWLSKSSGLKCSEHRWEVGVNVHFARLTRKKLIHSRLLFVSCFFGNLCNLMFFEGSGTFEQFPAVHLLGILKNRWRKTTKKTIIFTITSGFCYA